MSRTVRLLVVALLFVTAIGVHVIRAAVAPAAPDPVRIAAVQGRLDALPMELADGEFIGQRRSHDAEIVVKAGADSYAAAAFTTKDREYAFSSYIGGSTRPDIAFHAPDICLPAAGWTTLDDSLVDFEAFTPADPYAKMRRLHLRRDERDMICYFWFQSGTDVAQSIWQARFFNLEERLSGERNLPTYIVVVYVPVRNSVRHTDEAARSFLRAFGPPLLGAVQEPIQETGE